MGLYFILSIVSGLVSVSFASSPSQACRVDRQTLEAHGTESSNAGCVVSRKSPTNAETEFLMVYISKDGGKEEGWGFPGGKPASRSNDAKDDSKMIRALAARVSEDYLEPAPCTAARETFEETGIEVLVEELVSRQPKFLAFKCTPVDADQLKQVPAPKDASEIKKAAWISVSSILGASVKLRFDSDREIVEGLEKSR